MAHEFVIRNGLIIGTAAGTTAVDIILDEDDFTSDSDTALATQQSIKAYVDGLVVTASNTGSVGTGVFKQKTGVDLEFYKLNSTSSALTIALDGTDKIDFTVVASGIDHGGLGGLGDDDHTQYILVDGSRAFTGVVSGVTPTADAHLVTKGYVDGLAQGLDWQESVLDRFDPTAATPAVPSTGDRYISTATANGWTADNIYEWDGSAWEETAVSEGMATWVEDEDTLYVYNGSAWVKFGATVTHNNLNSLQGGNGSDEYYHLEAADHTALTDANAQLTAIQTDGSPEFVGVTLSGLTASRLMATDGSKAAASVTDLTSWIAGTANQITVTDDTDGTVTLSTPQDIHTGATPTFANLISSGYVRVGTTADTTAGNIRLNGTDFEGYTGSAWVKFTAPDDDFGVSSSVATETSIADADLILFYDASASAYKKITKDNLMAGSTLVNGSVGTISSATPVDTFADTTGAGAVWDYTAYDGTNFRTGTVHGVWNATANTVEYNDTSTSDIGDTSPLVLSVDITTDNVRLVATPASGTWTVSFSRKTLD